MSDVIGCPKFGNLLYLWLVSMVYDTEMTSFSNCKQFPTLMLHINTHSTSNREAVVRQLATPGSAHSRLRLRLSGSSIALRIPLILHSHVVCSGAKRHTSLKYCKSCPSHSTLHDSPHFRCLHTMQPCPIQIQHNVAY